MKFADRGLNPQAEALEEAQTLIRIAIRDGWLGRQSMPQINETVQKIIVRALKRIPLRDLREAAYRSLNAFAERQYATLQRGLGGDILLVTAGIAVLNNKPDSAEYIRAAPTVRRLAQTNGVDIGTMAKGVPLQEFARDYTRRRVVPVLDKIAEQVPLDPDDASGRNSLRNRAEMEVRYAAHLEQIDNLRTSGVKLVTCSVHADCSDRCYKWQGRVYSLDGTNGTTDDGKRYVPLEEATDVYYTTKAGKTYKNGLLGFNCRHYLMPYLPRMIIPHVDRETQQRERAINTRQRELERRVRDWREKALIFKRIDRDLYLHARRRAIDANKEYIQFSKDNGRAYYPSRTRLL